MIIIRNNEQKVTSEAICSTLAQVDMAKNWLVEIF